ncbi:Uncharacterised protein [Vibrio cholerae]|nr:Uncharacterised protein [Vibrio cholerae]CSA28465.1 Uncharacterised protein [Vibrio cholerae]CSA45259.1 Uncharacterised protein [Vibrio cholerae]
MFVSLNFEALRHVGDLPRPFACVSVVSHTRNGAIHHPHHRMVIFHERNDGREVAATCDELLSAIQRIHQPIALPCFASGKVDIGFFLREDRNIRGQLAQLLTQKLMCG